ncbi:MAG TPA: GYF domain-containing protein [Polyangia bacterium]|nr:GYF domain-containing protein [Polyangia bacterium]
MKIVCENCGAKYSIADEKIKGKVFKIRCKKCSESIVVRGDAQVEQPVAETPAYAPPPMPESAASGGEEEEGDAPTRVFDYSGYQAGGGAADEAVWHIVVEGEQQGPYTAGQLAEYLTAGNLDFETFVWREGFDDWKPIRDIPEIVSKTSGSPAPARAAVVAPVAAGGGGLFDQPAAGGGGLFDQPATGGGGLFDQPAAGGGGGLFDEADASTSPGGIFSSAGAQQRPSGGGLFDGGDAGGQDLFGGGEGGGIFASTGPAAAPSPRVSAQQVMTGARNENSVLFSLSNLQALALGGGAAGAPSGGGFGMFGSSKPASKGDEASGMIDIRSLAGSVPLDHESAGAPDDLLSIGGGGFAPALGAPVLTAHREGMGFGAKIGIIGGAVTLLAAAVVTVIFLTQNEDETKKDPGMDPQMAKLLAEIEKMKQGGDSAADAKKAEEALAAKKAEEQAAAAATASGSQLTGEGDDKKSGGGKASGGGGKASGGGGKAPKTSGGGEASGGGGESKPATSTGGGAAPSKPKSGGVSELDDLLGGGGSAPKPAKKPAAEAPAPAAGGGVPNKLTKGQVQSGMQSVARAVKACDTSGSGGTVTVQVTIAPNGRVTNANPTGASAGTPVGLCAARAVRKAKFPETQNSLNVTYPFKL